MADDIGKRYFFPRLAERNIDSHGVTFLWNHLCAVCRKQDLKSDPTGKTILSKILQHCSKEIDFIDSRTPLTEAVIKIILSTRNRGMSTEQITNELKSRWSMTTFPRPVSMKIISRLIEEIDGIE